MTDRVAKHPLGEILASLAVGLLPLGASAAEPATVSGPAGSARGADQSHEAESHHFVLGAKGSYLAAFADGDVHHFGGGGLFFELSLIPHWLELEYGIRAMTDGHGVIFPMDLLLKIPFRASDVVHPFVGIGPTFIPAFDERLAAHVGGVLAAGTYLWAWPWGGFVLEANYNLVIADHLEHEIGPNGGFAYRW